MYKVTNIDKTTQILENKGKRIGLKPGESIIVPNYVEESYTFHVEKIEKKKEEPKKLKGGKQ